MSLIRIKSPVIEDGTIVNVDLSPSAAIDFSKLAALDSANILVGNSGNVATKVAVTGDVTINNTGVTAIGNDKVVEAMINNLAVTTGKIADSAVTDLKLANNAVTSGKINNNAVTTSKIADSNVTIQKLANPQYTGFRNRIINGDFRVAQRGTSFVAGANNDDSYNLDRWYVLSDGNDVVDITRTTTDIPANGFSAIALDVETINKKFGIAQIIEQQNCVGLIGGNVTLTFKARVSSVTKLDNIKAAVVAWTGAADAVTSDIISAWGVEGTNPTLITDAVYENTPVNLGVSTSYATYSIAANVDAASTKNIIVFIWSDVDDTTLGDFLYITDVQLEPGTVSTPFEVRPVSEELALCQRYYYRSTASTNADRFGSGFATTTGIAHSLIPFPVTMRSAPVALEQTTTVADYRVFHGATSTTSTVAPSFITASPNVATVAITAGAALTVGHGLTIAAATTNAFLGFSAEL